MAILSLILASALTVAASPAVFSRETGCCFHITATGGPGGKVVQLSDGQNRINDTRLPEGKYCISSTGGLTDSNGRGCILTPPTTQWQCDTGATPTPGFYIGTDGALHGNGSSTFYSCPTEDHGAWNIYSETLKGEPKCVPIKLTADNCKAKTPVSPAPAPPKEACPKDLPKNFEFPHLIVPIDSVNIDARHGTSYNGTAGGQVSSIFNFDIPQSLKGKTCKLQFLFPKQEQLETSSYTFSGDGAFKFATLNGVADETTTYATSPKVKQDLGSFTLTPGSATEVASIGCPAGERISIWWHATGSGSLNYFQDFNPCPIGLYIVPE